MVRQAILEDLFNLLLWNDVERQWCCYSTLDQNKNAANLNVILIWPGFDTSLRCAIPWNSWHVRSRWKLDLRLRFQNLCWHLVRVSNSFQPPLKKILLTTGQPLACTKRNMVWATLCNPSWAPSRCINFMIRSMAAICVAEHVLSMKRKIQWQKSTDVGPLAEFQLHQTFCGYDMRRCPNLVQLPGALSLYSVFVHSYVSLQWGPLPF